MANNNTQKIKPTCPCGSGKTPFHFDGTEYCEDCAPLCIE